jgi:hypothetical protein
MLYAFFGSLAAQLPLLLAYAVGVVLAIINRRYYPRAMTYLLLAIGLSVVLNIGSTVFSILAPFYLMRGEYLSVTTYGYYTYAVGIISNFGHAAAFGLLLTAMFAGRSPHNDKPLMKS